MEVLFGGDDNGEGRMLGAYRLLGVLGSGGMGVVHAAWDTRLERRVALKTIHRHLLSDAAVTARFLREARAAARIEHPNVVRIYRVETIGDELAIEMQYIDGQPLSKRIGAAPLPAGQAVDLLQQVLSALDACHAQGVVHCDLKPANLLLTEQNHIYLADFGIARALEVSGSEAATETARSGPFWGTPRFSPPEAWDGARPDARWDLYALGVLVYEALAAKPAFTGHTPAGLMKQILTATPEPIELVRPDLSPELASLVTDLMVRDPESRPASAREALGRLLEAPETRLSLAETQPIPVGSGHGALPPDVVGPRLRFGPISPFALGMLAFLAAVPTFLIMKEYLRGSSPSSLASVEESAGVFSGPGEELEESAASAPAPPPLPEPFSLTATRFGVIFSYDDGVHGEELWAASLDGRIRLVEDLKPGPASSRPRRFYRRSNAPEVTLSATTPAAGEELWIYRAVGLDDFSLKMVKDIIPGRMGSEPHVLGSLDQLYVFYATTLHEGRELWLTNTREQQTAMIADIFPGSQSSAMHDPRCLIVPGGIYILGLDDSGRGQVMYYYDHALGYVREIADVCEDTGPMAMVGDALLFAHEDPEHGRELWVHRMGAGGISLLADLWPGSEGSFPNHLFAWKGRVYFQARAEAAGYELWVSDGTPEGTALFCDIDPGLGDGDPHTFVDGGDYLFFRGVTAEHGKELWMTDGTPAGTRLVADVWPGPADGNPYSMTGAGDRVFFTADDGAHGAELYMYRYGGAVERVTDLWPGEGGAEPYEFSVVGSTVGMFKFKRPDGPALGVVDWSAGEAVVTVIELPHARKGSANASTRAAR